VLEVFVEFVNSMFISTFLYKMAIFVFFLIILYPLGWVFSRGKKQSRRDADPSPLSSAVVKKE